MTTVGIAVSVCVRKFKYFNTEYQHISNAKMMIKAGLAETPVSDGVYFSKWNGYIGGLQGVASPLWMQKRFKNSILKKEF